MHAHRHIRKLIVFIMLIVAAPGLARLIDVTFN